MTLNKFDRTSDAVADLYRAAYYLALNSKEMGLSFLIKAKEKLGKNLNLDINKIRKESATNSMYWAEKILDEHNRLKMNLLSN